MSQIDTFSLNGASNTSVQNFNRYLHISDPPKVIVPRFNWNREKPHPWNVIKPRETIKEYRKLFRAKKQTSSRDDLCTTQKCIKEIVRIVSLADNHCVSSDEDPSEDSNEAKVEFDYNNPQNLDIQGIDQMQTYRKDEQYLQEKREYEVMKRELDKRRLVVEEKERYEQQVHEEKFKLPDLYNIDIDPIYGGNSRDTSELMIEPINIEFDETLKEQDEDTSDFHRDVVLYRTIDKPKNRSIIEAETERRVAALQERLMKMWEKEKRDEEERLEMEKKVKEELSFTLAQNDFDKHYEETKPEDVIVRPPDPKPPVQYPNTFKELRSFRRKLNRDRRKTRDKCLVREKVFEELGKRKFCKEKLLYADDVSDDVASISPQSSDGEDGLEMGYQNSQEFLVRGMHDKFSNEPRGKYLNRGKNRTVKTCLNREEWIQSSFAECEREKTLRKVHYSTNDITHESYDIFHKEWKYEKPKNVKSPVKEYIEKGSRKILETSTKTTPPIFKAPKYVKVRSFNLTDYLYGSRKGKKIFEDDEKLHLEQEQDVSEKNELLQRLKRLEQEDGDRLKKIRNQRLKYLGFACQSKKQTHSKENIIESDTDSDWLPDDEPLEHRTMKDSPIQLKSETIPLSISNMRAPDLREPTIRRHPRRLRQKSLTTVHEDDSRAPLNVPRLQKMDYDEIRQSNLTEKKKELNTHFKYRHHHDHLEHTQQKMVRVKYVPKMQKFNETFNAINDTQNIENTEAEKDMVNFPLKSDGFKDWSRYFSSKESVLNIVEDNDQKYVMSEEMLNDAKLEQDPLPEFEKSRFNHLIKSKHKEHISEASGSAERANYEYPDAEKYRQQILDEQSSAVSCLSSASSSICTNFTNDSGSFFIITDKKVPLDYLMKSKVPFVPMNENHRQAKLIEKEDEYHTPYLAVANAGQQIEMREMCVPKDKFYTQVTRDRAGIRDRLKVEHVTLEEQLIGYEDEKFKPRFG